MKRILIAAIVVLFLTGSTLQTTAQAPGDSIYYYQSFDSEFGRSSQRSLLQTTLFLDEFDKPDFSPGATFHLNKPRFTLEDNPGHLRMIFPKAAVFDHWTGNDAAPALHVLPPARDWAMTTLVVIRQPAQGGFFHTGLIVRFAQNNLFYWGIYQAGQLNQIRLERTGIQDIFHVDLSGVQNLPVELAIIKSGSTYSFHYRFIVPRRSGPPPEWILVGIQNDTRPPLAIGLIGKTWVGTNLIADFDYLRIE